MLDQELDMLQRSMGCMEDSVKQLRDQQSAQQTVLAKIETMLSERSCVWDRSIGDVRSDVESLKKRLWTISGAAAALSAVGSQLFSKFF